MSKINTLLKDEAKLTSDFQGRLKSMIMKSIKENGLDKDAVRASMEPELRELTRDRIRGYLKLGLNWLKGKEGKE